MANVKFGLGQIANQTPQFATNIFRVVLYLCAIVGVVLASFSEIPDHTKVTILKIAAEITVFVHAISRMFGIDISNDPTQQNKNNAPSTS